LKNCVVYDKLVFHEWYIEYTHTSDSAQCPALFCHQICSHVSCRFSSWPCVQVAYNKFCSLSPKRDILVQGLLAYLPSLWVDGSTEECEETVTSVKKILEALQKEHVSSD